MSRRPCPAIIASRLASAGASKRGRSRYTASMLGSMPPARCTKRRSAARASSAKDSVLASDHEVEQQPHLLGHWVNDRRTRLQRAEALAQPSLDALAPSDVAEGDETAHGRQRWVGLSPRNPLRLRASDLLPGALPSAPLSPLAPENISAHLMNARRSAWFCHRKESNVHGEH